MRARGEPAGEKVERGGWILALLAALALGVFAIDEIQRGLAEGAVLRLALEESEGLRSGAPVWLGGHRIGRITDVELGSPASASDRRVLVRAVLREEAADRLRADASATVRPSGLMRPPVVSLRPGSPGAPPWDFSDTLEARTGVSAADLRARMDRLRGALDSLRRTEERILALADTGGGTVARWRRDAAMRERLRRVRGGLARVFRRLAAGPPGLDRLSGDGGAAGLAAGLSAADSLAGRFRRTAGRWAALADRLSSLRSRAGRLHRGLREARGSAGRLLRDEALERELEELRSRIRATRAELLADPSSWLRIRLF